MSSRPYEELRHTHGSPTQLIIDAQSLGETLGDIAEGYHEAWNMAERGRASHALEKLARQIEDMRETLGKRPEERFQGVCSAPMLHVPDGGEWPCVREALHLRFDGEDHKDAHGHTAKPVVSWSTIEEVRRVQEARERGEIT